jgi:hypothetical protein
MPTPGLSLVGFMEPQHALNYLRAACVPPDASDAALLAEWTTAKARLGPPFTNAGQPDIQPIPPGDQAYVHQLQQQPWVQQALASYPGATFQVVEIDPLLAYQFHILGGHSDNHYPGLKLGPEVADLLPICLPMAPPNENIRISAQGQSLLIGADSLNVRITAQGWFQAENKVGIQFGIGLPFVHVTRWNGRCYLTNGFHRALGARIRGAGRIPCLFRDVANAEEIGIRPDGATFSVALLTSSDPPTLGHFTQGRAYDVPIRQASRILQVNWSEHALPLE